jgi:exodeoxyribonuclease VII small subunit
MVKTVKTNTSEPSFEQSLTELEAIVATMEDGKMTLEQSLASYKRGAELLKICQSQLQDAQAQVKILENDHLKNFGAIE